MGWLVCILQGAGELCSVSEDVRGWCSARAGPWQQCPRAVVFWHAALDPCAVSWHVLMPWCMRCVCPRVMPTAEPEAVWRSPADCVAPSGLASFASTYSCSASFSLNRVALPDCGACGAAVHVRPSVTSPVFVTYPVRCACREFCGALGARAAAGLEARGMEPESQP